LLKIVLFDVILLRKSFFNKAAANINIVSFLINKILEVFFFFISFATLDAKKCFNLVEVPLFCFYLIARLQTSLSKQEIIGI